MTPHAFPVGGVAPRPEASPRGFEILPAIDVREGRVVRLAQGDYARETRYRDDPFELASAYADAGARTLHLVDLDAAKSGGYTLLDLVGRVARDSALDVQTGGGVRSAGDVARLLDAGATRVVVGTLAVTQPETVLQWIARFGTERICVAIDVRQGPDARWCAATHGWTASVAEDALPLIAKLAAGGLRHLLSTDIARDGMLSGPSLGWYEALRERVPELRVQGSGGIGTLADVRALRSVGCAAAIIGRALLEGRFELRDALAC